MSEQEGGNKCGLYPRVFIEERLRLNSPWVNPGDEKNYYWWGLSAAVHRGG